MYSVGNSIIAKPSLFLRNIKIKKKETYSMQIEINRLAAKYQVSTATIETLLRGLQAGQGRQVQFNIAELGGQGQWMPGMVMIGDMFNSQLKARVDSLCSELATLLASNNVSSANSWADFAPFGTNKATWWPEKLGHPSAQGGQNDWEYAYFPTKNRLAIKQAVSNKITFYDTTGYVVTGVGQQQQTRNSSLMLNTTQGSVELNRLKIVAE
jgi:hypothetical protein